MDDLGSDQTGGRHGGAGSGGRIPEEVDVDVVGGPSGRRVPIEDLVDAVVTLRDRPKGPRERS
jgi:hypothetical protein